MREVLPGVYHWQTTHPRIHFKVSSYWLQDGGVLLDPLVPEDVGMDWFRTRAQQPQVVLLTNRHHLRHSQRYREAFGCPIMCNRAGLHEFAHDEQVEAFDPGDRLPGEVLAKPMGGISPDDTALYLDGRRTLCFADAIVRGGEAGELGFVPDSLMDDPPATKGAVLAALARLLAELEFENVLLAHGAPLIGDGRERLQELLDAGGRTAFEL